MAFVVFYGAAGVVGILCHGATWWFSVGRGRWRAVVRFFTNSLLSSVLFALLFGGASYIVNGHLQEPERFIPMMTILALPASAVAGIPFLLLGSRRYPAGCCQKCGYDLTGNESGRCPECAQPFMPETQQADVTA